MSQVTGPEALYFAPPVFNPIEQAVCRREVARIQTKIEVNALIDDAWTKLQQLTASDKSGLWNLLLKRDIQFSPEATLSVKVDSFYRLAEAVNLELGCTTSQPPIQDPSCVDPFYKLVEAVNLELERSPEKPTIRNPFSVEQYIAANERLKLKQVHDAALTALWNQGIFPQLDRQSLPKEKIPYSPEGIRAFLNDPANAPRLAKITYLALRGSAYKILPPEISHFRGLKFLILSELALSRFAPDLTGLTELREIFVTKCPLSDFSADLSPCVKLERLIITKCPKINFSPPFPLPSTLKQLDLSDNALESFDVDLAHYPLLCNVDLSGNQLENFTPPLSGTLRLEKLNLSGNPLRHIGVELNDCQVIILSP